MSSDHHGPRLVVLETPAAVDAYVADILVDAVVDHPSAVLGLATGESMIGVYREAVTRSRQRNVAWERVRTFNVDEFVGLPPGHPGLYRRFMEEHLQLPMRVGKSQFPAPPRGKAATVELECEHYDREIERAGGIDLLLLGIGLNGHIAFNEPGSSFGSRTRIVALTDETRRHVAATYPGEDVPRLAATVGVATILGARRIVVVAKGPEKAAPVGGALCRAPATCRPASALQAHPDVAFVVDREASIKCGP